MEKMNKVIEKVLKVLSEEEKDALLKWAEECKEVVDSRRKKKNKIKKLTEITRRNNDALKSVFKVMGKNLQKYLWTDRGFVARCAVAGAGAGILTGGFGGAGIACLGTAIGVPFFLVTAAGGAFLGMLISEIRKGKK